MAVPPTLYGASPPEKENYYSRRCEQNQLIANNFKGINKQKFQQKLYTYQRHQIKKNPIICRIT